MTSHVQTFCDSPLTFLYTGGPRNSRTFYLRIRLFTMGKNVLKFGIRGILASFPSLIRDFLVKLGFKIN